MIPELIGVCVLVFGFFAICMMDSYFNEKHMNELYDDIEKSYSK